MFVVALRNSSLVLLAKAHGLLLLPGSPQPGDISEASRGAKVGGLLWQCNPCMPQKRRWPSTVLRTDMFSIALTLQNREK